MRTIYALGEDGKPKPVQVKLGISDGIMTEVTDGLKEGDKIITGTVQAKNDSGGNTTPSNLFGGGGFPVAEHVVVSRMNPVITTRRPAQDLPDRRGSGEGGARRFVGDPAG